MYGIPTPKLNFFGALIKYTLFPAGQKCIHYSYRLIIPQRYWAFPTYVVNRDVHFFANIHENSHFHAKNKCFCFRHTIFATMRQCHIRSKTCRFNFRNYATMSYKIKSLSLVTCNISNIIISRLPQSPEITPISILCFFL